MVLDASTGEPVIGANVIVKGTTNGVITDLDGVYELNAPAGAVLQISFVGYKTIEVKAEPNMKVNLKEDTETLDEVVVVGYGTQRRESLTGSLQTVKENKLKDVTTANVENMLNGKVSGVFVAPGSGQPGSSGAVMVRGKASINGSSSPLWVIDGVIVGDGAGQLNPADIETMTILKDAASTAIYGSQGANGVILVTTRRGQEGKATISITSSVGVQQPTRILKMADSYTYATLFNEMNDNDGKSKHTFDDYALERFRLGDDPIMYPNMNWRKYIRSAVLRYGMQ